MQCQGKSGGLPDIHILYDGITFEIETKTDLETGELRTMQEKQRDKLIKAGAFYLAPKTKKEFVTWFEKIISDT